VVVPVSIRSASVTEQNGHLVHSLRAKANEVPHGIRVLAVCSGVPLLRVDERWKQHRVSDEEDGCVVADKIPISICV
jgi:hypothetical protein